MRKYQQLFLVIVSFISISVLLIYKSENNRLKYVLQVVNFFGRNDATILSRLENVTKHDIFTDFSNPLPVWQRVSDDFYVYSAFWEELDSSLGGDVIAIAVGRQDATMQFKCSFRRENGSDVKGTFVFMPVSLHDNDEKRDDEQFVLFKFMCKIAQQNILQEPPKTLILTEVKTGREQEIILRIVRPIEDESKISTASLVVCLNIVPYKSWKIKNFFLNRNLMQFFMHHKIIGIEEFLIYNGDLIPLEVKKMLSKAGMHVHYFPFNFPFSSNMIRTRGVVEMDCLMRTAGSSKYAILLEPNEFFYPNNNIHLKDSVIASLSDYANHINHFELATFSVCLDHKNKLLVDNHFHDTGNNIGHKIYISKSSLHPQNGQNMTLPISKVFAHNYINCISSKGLWDWRNAIRKDFMQYILTVRNEMGFLF